MTTFTFNPRKNSFPCSFCVDGQWYDMLSDQVYELQDCLGIDWTNAAIVELARSEGWTFTTHGSFIVVLKPGTSELDLTL